MKNLFVLSLLAAATTAFGIEFITEADVQKELKAEKVIEITKYSVESLVQDSSNCQDALASRSGRAYVVKADKKVSLYLTPSGLKGLTVCGDLL